MLTLSVVVIGVGVAMVTAHFATDTMLLPSQEGEAFDWEAFYGTLLQKADRKQADQLHELAENQTVGLPGVWKRDALIIMGELPKDTPRLTLIEAESILKNEQEQSSKKSQNRDNGHLAEAFNQIAGAPDWIGGFGIERSIYFLDDEQNYAIYLMLDKVLYASFDEHGNYEVTPLFPR